MVLIMFPSPTPVTHAQTSTIDLAHLFHSETSATVREEREMQVWRGLSGWRSGPVAGGDSSD